MPQLGTPIDINQTNDLLKQNANIKKTTFRHAAEAVVQHSGEIDAIEAAHPGVAYFQHFLNKICNFYNSNANIYIFSKEDLERLFNDGANFIMIIQGSHLLNDAVVRMGQPTVIAAGCNETGHDNQGTVYTCINTAQPATEHPPFRTQEVISFIDKAGNATLQVRIKYE